MIDVWNGLLCKLNFSVVEYTPGLGYEPLLSLDSMTDISETIRLVTGLADCRILLERSAKFSSNTGAKTVDGRCLALGWATATRGFEGEVVMWMIVSLRLSVMVILTILNSSVRTSNVM